jgi:hypothetical protein
MGAESDRAKVAISLGSGRITAISGESDLWVE